MRSVDPGFKPSLAEALYDRELADMNKARLRREALVDMGLVDDGTIALLNNLARPLREQAVLTAREVDRLALIDRAIAALRVGGANMETLADDEEPERPSERERASLNATFFNLVKHDQYLAELEKLNVPPPECFVCYDAGWSDGRPCPACGRREE